MSEAQSSDAMKNLVWFVIALAILGIILAFALIFTGVVPVDAGFAAPLNTVCPPVCMQPG